jgi:hypothetical protein
VASEAITAGGAIFLIVTLEPAEPQVREGCVRLLRCSATLLAGVAICSAVLAALVLRSSATDFRWSDMIRTTFFWSALSIAGSAAAIRVMVQRRHAQWVLVPTVILIGGALMTTLQLLFITSRASRTLR